MRIKVQIILELFQKLVEMAQFSTTLSTFESNQYRTLMVNSEVKKRFC